MVTKSQVRGHGFADLNLYIYIFDCLFMLVDLNFFVSFTCSAK